MRTPAKQTGRASQRNMPSSGLLATQMPAATVGSSSGMGAPAPASTRAPKKPTMGQTRAAILSASPSTTEASASASTSTPKQPSRGPNSLANGTASLPSGLGVTDGPLPRGVTEIDYQQSPAPRKGSRAVLAPAPGPIRPRKEPP